MKRAIVIGDYTGKVHAIYPVADSFTHTDDLQRVEETALYYNQTATLLDIEDECCVGEITRRIAELNGEDTSDTDEEMAETVGKCFPVE